MIQIDDVSGVVEHIGIRASIMRTNERSEVIMPNGKLISDRVSNWTLTNRQHGIELPLAVAPGVDPTKVVNLLEQAAGSHPLVAKNPPPRALVVKLGPDALGLELRVWTDRLEQWMDSQRPGNQGQRRFGGGEHRHSLITTEAKATNRSAATAAPACT